MRGLLRLEAVNYKYEGKYTALNGVSVSFKKGERVAVLGANGAGKSTFFLCCNGVLRPQSGRIFLNGKEVTGSKSDVLGLRQSVGLVFQEPDSQIIAGTVESEVSFGPMNLKLPEAEVLSRVTRSLFKMNLSGYENRAPQYLSGGEKKRVSIADILAMQPEIILFDEPEASLDPENVELLEETLDELSGAGIALAVSTHDVDFAWRFADRAIVFSEGRVIADDDIEKVFASDDALSNAGLKKPLLFETAEILERRFPGILPKKPKTSGELNNCVKRYIGV